MADCTNKTNRAKRTIHERRIVVTFPLATMSEIILIASLRKQVRQICKYHWSGEARSFGRCAAQRRLPPSPGRLFYGETAARSCLRTAGVTAVSIRHGSALAATGGKEIMLP